MNTGRFSPIVGGLLVLLVIAALVVAFSENPTRKKAEEVALAVEPTASIMISPQPTTYPTVSPQPTSSQQTPMPARTIMVTIIPDATGTPPTYVPRQTPDATQVAWHQTAEYLNYVFSIQPGQIIAEGSNTISVSQGIELLSYRVERVVMTQTITFKVAVPAPTPGMPESQLRTFSTIYRLSVTGGPFKQFNVPWAVWLDDTLVGLGQGGGASITAIIFDQPLLREGARIGVSYGFRNPTYLPETLHFTILP